MLRLLKGLIKTVIYLLVIVLLTPVAGLGYGFLTTSAPSVSRVESIGEPPAELRAQAVEAIPGYQRSEESTFLTYPEWAIVYAAREYAGFVAERPAYNFPYWAYIGRFWQDYAMVVRATNDYPFNFQNHLMLVVIGTSHTIEHAIQWAYENSFGRLTALVAPPPIAEDRYLAEVAAEYAAFLDQVPWYRFDYASKRTGLWQVPSADGTAVIRSWERKLAFGLANTVKQAYADLIASGLSATSDPALLDIHVWARGPVALAITGEDDTTIERDFGDEGAVFVTTRYQRFTELLPRLVNRGLRFAEIGGNGAIFLTTLSSGPLAAPPSTVTLFSYALPAKPETWRTGIVAQVGTLHEVVPALARTDTELEHIYDY